VISCDEFHRIMLLLARIDPAFKPGISLVSHCDSRHLGQPAIDYRRRKRLAVPLQSWIVGRFLANDCKG
jgi:hypothetical protein